MTAPDYELLDAQLRALVGEEPDALAAVSNFVALLYNAMTDVNWLGVYVLRGDELVLGPFQGKPACVHIGLDEGVCGAAVSSGETQRVADVHAFPGHIVCDPDSRSELVIPLVVHDRVVGVLDIDSPVTARFAAVDQAGLERLCRTFCDSQEGRKYFI